ncbi:PTS system beta-glucosides-specific IIC component/PTS system sucrose-specific IIC component [Clostridium acetobutylicum]|uniref:Fusion: PTS system, beta-glucosides specific IIABC component n=2 Tax=Clostridium acetobutylicum TaxID=1488 RepID=Q7D469_CLOAB|nr:MULTISPECIES: sucrose-specific PTS transporter subunit IIBC [Clostridium]AAF35839.1 ScrA [Clostridium acetobutylicum ATCC 824]AAK78403.1 Fusion: PTS system, beta-glucosides specific IIABC component [Clostridium acetobutylicum ATCC 824]ADZ19473.1 Fusion: PTS system, beta-glucosides specific IIABC component [Clostridium acetobutylicum EA 2018]AEI33535.1 fusion: PTS system, beta-glucosides specific IIABC component [Clostridium acetobutylicum DSM 1731]AWV80126.1 PTS beta-glucoside transporter s
MDYNKTAKDILKLLGGEKNVMSAAHCATRLRLVLKNEKEARTKEIEKLDGVKGVFSSSGQYQIIIGQGSVNKVYKAFVEGTGISESSLSDTKKAAMKNMNLFERFARMLSNIFVPIIPAIVASGLLMGLLGMLDAFHLVNSKSGLYVILNMFSNAAFQFLPMIIAFSAAREFKTNPYLAAALGAIMIHPDLQNAWTLGEGIKHTINIFGLNIGMVGYQGTVLPILISVWVMSYIEKGLRKIVPEALDILLTPFLTLMITGFFAMVVIGPGGRFVGDEISLGLQTLYNTTGFFSGVLFGGLYSLIVITGIHHSFHAIEAGLLANPAIHKNFLLPIWSMANVAQGGAALAVYFKTRDKKMKSIAAPASFSCLLGITEPAIFGVNLRYTKPFIAGALGGAIGGGYIVFTKVAMTAVGVTGIPGIAIVKQGSFLNYIIAMILAFGGAFIIAMVLGIKEEITEEDLNKETVNKDIKVEEVESVVSPVNGKVVLLKNVPDKTFAEGLIGDGIGVDPEDGEVVSPIDGTVVHVFETKHAIAMKSKNGVEMLIHIGIDTVKMEGNGFKSFINDGEEVKKGDKLIQFDLDLVKEKAVSPIVLTIVTNHEDMGFVNSEKIDGKQLRQKDEILKIGIK